MVEQERERKRKERERMKGQQIVLWKTEKDNKR